MFCCLRRLRELDDGGRESVWRAFINKKDLLAMDRMGLSQRRTPHTQAMRQLASDLGEKKEEDRRCRTERWGAPQRSAQNSGLP